MTTIPWPFLLLLFYALLDKEPIGKKEIIPGSEDHPPVEDDTTTFSFRDRLNVAKDIFPYITFLFITYFSEYLSNHAVITTLAFPNAPFKPRDHYPYYILSYHVGKFMGRSHFFLVSAINPKLVHYIRVRRTWILALIAFLHGLFFFLASWYRFVPRVEIIIALCFTEGFTAGSMYLNSAHTVSELIADQQKKEFALSLLTVGNACGKLAAGLCGLFQEPLLKKHCVEDLKLGEYCLTRHTRKAGWNKSLNCWIFNYCCFRRKLGERGEQGGDGGRGKGRQGNLVFVQYLSRYLFSRPIFSSGLVSDPSLSKFVIHLFLVFPFFWGGGGGLSGRGGAVLALSTFKGNYVKFFYQVLLFQNIFRVLLCLISTSQSMFYPKIHISHPWYLHRRRVSWITKSSETDEGEWVINHKIIWF